MSIWSLALKFDELAALLLFTVRPADSHWRGVGYLIENSFTVAALKSSID